jgi:hypothetical protein
MKQTSAVSERPENTLPGKYVSISGKNRKLQSSRGAARDPVALSTALIKAFAFELTI